MKRVITIAAMALITITTGCASPDSDAQLSEFQARADAVTYSEPKGCSPTLDTDLTGTYLVGLNHPDALREPIAFQMDITGSPESYDISLQPLAREDCPNADQCNGKNPRDPVGSPIEFTGVIPEDDGSIILSASEATIEAPAHAGIEPPGDTDTTLSGGAITTSINVTFFSCEDGALCGTEALLDISAPVEVTDLEVDMAAEATSDLSVETMPDIPYSCRLVPSEIADISEGTFLVGVFTDAGILNGPITFQMDVVASGSAFDVTLQPLARPGCPEADECNGKNAREPVGEPIVFTGVTQNEDGLIGLSSPNIVVEAPANTGITGGEIQAAMSGFVVPITEDFLCAGLGDATVELDVTSPITLDNLEVTLGGIRTDDVSLEAFPEPPIQCADRAEFDPESAP